MPGTSLRLGPFDGGMNTLSSEGSTAPNEMVDCVNFDIKVDGNLISRPPITNASVSNPWVSNIAMLGFFTLESGTYILGSVLSSTSIYSKLGEAGVWTLVTNTLKSSSMVQYKNEVYFINEGSVIHPTGGGKWNGTTFTYQANMPTGKGGCLLKDRLWIFGGQGQTNSSRVYYSKPSDFTNWTAPDGGFFDVGPGDGQYITSIIPYNDSLVIFKNASTWVLSFNNDPGSGSLRQISTVVGASNQFNVVIFENILYCLFNKTVYTLNNNFFTAINIKVPFKYDTATSSPFDARFVTFLTTIGSRLIAQYYNTTYIYHIRQGVWTKWESDKNFGPFFRYPFPAAGSGDLLYFAGSALSADTGFYRLRDGFALETESMICKIRTRNYDFDDPSRFKRLFWWGADISTYGTITATSVLVSSNQRITYRDLQMYKYSELATGTWQQPTASATKSTFVPSQGKFVVKRKFVKLLKGLRFRQVYFSLAMPTNGTASEAPLEFYGLRAFIGNKEKVVKQSN